MDINNLERNIGKVKSSLRVLPNGSVEALQELEVHIPKRFEQSKLAEIYESVDSICMIGIVVGNYYCSLTALTSITLEPSNISERVINNEKYYILHFYPGDTVIRRLTTPQESTLQYNYYLEFTKYARIPWYLNFEIICSVFDESRYYNGKAMGNSNQAFRVIYSLTCRDPNDLDIPFRYSKALDDKNKMPKIIGINNPGQLLSGVFARLTGGYLSDNIIAGAMEENSKVTTLEEVLKGIPDGRDLLW